MGAPPLKVLCGIALLFGLFIYFSFSVNQQSIAETPGPSEELKRAVTETLTILDNPAIAPLEKRERVRKIILPLFDLERMAKLALGRHWKANRSRMPEFVPLFSGILERAYLNFGMLKKARGINIEFLSEKINEDNPDKAEVFTKVVTRKSEINVIYKLVRVGERWLIYDISVENISLIASYRAQFNEEILTSSFDELLKKMREKLSQPEGNE